MTKDGRSKKPHNQNDDNGLIDRIFYLFPDATDADIADGTEMPRRKRQEPRALSTQTLDFKRERP